MGSFSLMHWIVVLAIIVILFGAGKLPRMMGDFARGIKTFKEGMKEEDEPEAAASPAHLLPPGTAAGSVVPVVSVVDGTREPAKNI